MASWLPEHYWLMYVLPHLGGRAPLSNCFSMIYLFALGCAGSLWLCGLWWCTGFSWCSSCCRARAPEPMGFIFMALGLSSCGSRALEHSVNSCGGFCHMACGSFLDEGSSPCLLHCHEDSLPLSHRCINPIIQCFSWYLHRRATLCQK